MKARIEEQGPIPLMESVIVKGNGAHKTVHQLYLNALETSKVSSTGNVASLFCV